MFVPHRLSAEYDSLYTKGIIAFQGCLNDDSSWYLDFYPSFGATPLTLEFLVYGQALNGWGNGFYRHDMIDQQKLSQSVYTSNRRFEEEGHCALDWVNVRWTSSSYRTATQKPSGLDFYPPDNYRCYRSFFWNVTYKTVCDYYHLDREDWDWSKKIAWSNLYKIAPEDANPTWEEKLWQRDSAIDLVRQEIDEIKPKYAVFLTGVNWFNPFASLFKAIATTELLASNIEYIGRRDDTLAIVTHRPRFGNSNAYAAAILDVIRRNNGLI